MIVATLVFCFQHDDHPTLLDVLAHVKIGIYPFPVALWNTRAMSPEVIRSHLLSFKSLVVQSYLQTQYFFMDQLHEQEFTLLLANAPLDVV